MKILAVLIISVIGLATADTFGQYIPKAFFTIDENGNPTPVQPINVDTLRRIRRQIQPIQPFGNPGFGFQQPIFNFPPVQPGNGQGSFVSTSQTLNSRFGEDEPIVSGQTTVIHSNDGKYQQTNTYLRPDGSVTSNKQSGRVKRQQSQTQSQNGEGGNQLQSQSQNQPSGQQFQTQSQGQGQGHEPVVPPTGNQQHAPLSNSQGQGNQQHVPQNNQGQNNQQYEPSQSENRNQNNNQGQGNPNQYTPQNNQGPNYQQGVGYNQQPFLPFGIGGFGATGFQNPFFVPMPGFGFGNPFPGPLGQQPGFGNPQPGFGAGAAGGAGFQPGPGSQTSFTGSTQTLDNRFGGEDETVVTGGTQTITSSGNGNFHATTSVLKPDGQVITTQQSGKLPSKMN